MGRTVEKKRKKKGRPSLLDLQKRNLRLQKEEQQNNSNPNPSPNPSLRFPNSGADRRLRRRHPDQEAADDDDEEEDEESGGKRREKKLKLVLRLPNQSSNSPRDASGSASPGSESDAGGDAALRKRKIGCVDVDREKAERQNYSSRTTDPSELAATTPLPDKKLLVFILDRLQKKDTYGVFSEPVDPEELPDYHDIIENPMDFGTLRKKLSNGAYAYLEEFEKDVFLISSNAMRYNASDTIYFRQARSIHELAKKDFENLRQESDDNEPEPKTVRRGRPPSKNVIKRTVGRPPAERTGSSFSDATLANAGDHWFNFTHDMPRKGSTLDKPSTDDLSTRAAHGLRYTETYSRNGEHKSERKEEYSGSVLKGVPMKYWKKPVIMDENRRDTYRQSQLSTCAREPSLLTTFDGEKKLLIPVGLHMERAYARSLARFAAKLGPIGWEIAAKRIERVLPRGTNFGPGWIGDGEAPQQCQQPAVSVSPPHPSSQPKNSSSTTRHRTDEHPESQEPPANNLAVEETHPTSDRGPASAAPNGVSDSVEIVQSVTGLNHDRGFNLPSGGGVIRSRTPFRLHQDQAMQHGKNGFNAAHGYNLLSQVEKMVGTARPTGSFGSDTTMMTHARALDMASRGSNGVTHQAPASQSDAENTKLAGNSSTQDSVVSLPDPTGDPPGQRRGSSLNPKPGPAPPDLNVGFLSSGSPVSGVLVDSQQPDLALQL